MGEWIFSCWACGAKTPMQDPVRRKDSCQSCQADMHACKNCQFHNPDVHNQCVEPVADFVPDKERSNFCGMYQAFAGERPKAADITDAKAKLEALFKKPR